MDAMTKYQVFTRCTCHKDGSPYPQAPRRRIAVVDTEAEARQMCRERNEPHDFRGRGANKVFAEYERIYK